MSQTALLCKSTTILRIKKYQTDKFEKSTEHVTGFGVFNGICKMF